MDFENRNENICMCRRCRGIVYVVRKGDTLYSIANRFGVTVNDVLNANRYINIYNLQIGDKLCIPVMPPRPRTMEDDGMTIDYGNDGAFEQNEMEKEDKDNEKFERLQNEMREAYKVAMSNPLMGEFMKTKETFESLVNNVYSIINFQITGETGSCDKSNCASCGGGCH
jgi:LysM repeat protein